MSGWLHGGEHPELPFSQNGTSLEAAQAAENSAGGTRARVLALIRSSGEEGHTDDEIEAALEMRHQSASARRRELVLNGSIVWSGRKRKTRSGCNANVWTAVCAAGEPVE